MKRQQEYKRRTLIDVLPTPEEMVFDMARRLCKRRLLNILFFKHPIMIEYREG